MVEVRHVKAVFLAMVTAVALVLVASEAGAQPPVARPQPPPKPTGTETTTPPVTTPKPGQTTAARPTANQPTANQPPKTDAAGRPGPPVAKPTEPVTTPASTSVTPAAPPASTPTPRPAASRPAATAPAAAAPAGDQAPTEAYLGSPILPNAHYLGSYDAGGAGQRFFLFGTAQHFTDVVAYYRTVLRQKGELVFEMPATHMFEVGRFREDQVAFPPGVTVKDYSMGGSPGLANPRLGATPAAFPTVIQIVPPAVVPPAPTRR